MNLGTLLAADPRATIEGQVVAVADEGAVASRSEAELRAHRIRAGMQGYVQTRREIAEATRRRDWQALGYESWDAWREGEFGEAKLRVPADERPQIVEILRSAGMSTRAIGSAVGASEATVRRDLRAASNDAPATVVGRDGKAHPASKPPRKDPADPAPTATGTGPAAGTPPLSAPAAAAASSDVDCEKCGAALGAEQAEAGYMRCDGCDPEGDHIAAMFPRAGGQCVVCHGRPGEPVEKTPEPPPPAAPADPHRAEVIDRVLYRQLVGDAAEAIVEGARDLQHSLDRCGDLAELAPGVRDVLVEAIERLTAVLARIPAETEERAR